MARGDAVTYLLSVAKDQSLHVRGIDKSTSWANETCPHCGHSHALVVAAQVDGNFHRRADFAEWYRCVACLGAYVRQDGVVHPATRPLRTPQGVPDDEEAVWEEARGCLGIGANTAAVMLCRKLLFHIAVTHGLAPANDKGFAPGFAECAKHLQKEGLVTPRMMKWVDRIKDIGNDANHKLEAITAQQALDVATFTEQLLVLAYELDARMEASNSTLEGPDDEIEDQATPI